MPLNYLEYSGVAKGRRLGGESNREIVSCRAVCACVRSGCLVESDLKSPCPIFLFPFMGRRAFPFPFLGRRAFPFPSPSPPDPQTSYPTLVGLRDHQCSPRDHQCSLRDHQCRCRGDEYLIKRHDFQPIHQQIISYFNDDES